MLMWTQTELYVIGMERWQVGNAVTKKQNGTHIPKRQRMVLNRVRALPYRWKKTRETQSTDKAHINIACPKCSSRSGSLSGNITFIKSRDQWMRRRDSWLRRKQTIVGRRWSLSFTSPKSTGVRRGCRRLLVPTRGPVYVISEWILHIKWD